MADNYDDYISSSTYGEDDMEDGGEQISAALNQQLYERDKIISTKQNAVVVTPSEPPLNPQNGDLWIDNSQWPNVAYVWDAAAGQWNRYTPISAEEVGSYTVAQVDDALANIQMDMDAVSSRVEITEEQLADGEGLASTITQTNTYQTDRNSAVQSGIDGLVSDLQDENTAQTLLPSFVTQGQLVEKADEIVANFKSAGGVNLIKNSVGYGGLTHWQLISGTFDQYIGADCIEAGSGLTTTTGVIKQAVTAISGQPYTLTAKVAKGTAGSAYMKLSDGSTFQQVNIIETAAYNYDTIQIAGFVPASNMLIVELSGTGVTGGVVFTAIMLNTGIQGLQWSQANGEVYTTGVHMDINGLRVDSNQYDGYTVMSPEEFAGYYRNAQGTMQKVFTLNKDTTEVAKLKVTDPNAELTMGSVKVSYVNGGGHTGWAFVPAT